MNTLEKNESLQERRQQRDEVGAVWTKTTKNSESEYMTIKLKLDQEQLNHLLSQLSNDNVAVLELVAFPYTGGETNGRRPTYRVFPDIRD